MIKRKCYYDLYDLYDKIRMALFVLFWVALIAIPAYFIVVNGPIFVITCIGDCWDD